MGLKKKKSGSKYEYAKVGYVGYTPGRHVEFHMEVLERDTKTISEEQYNALAENARGIYVKCGDEYELAPKLVSSGQFPVVIQKGSDDEFSVENQEKAGNNIVKSCYEWLKANSSMFKGWEDC